MDFSKAYDSLKLELLERMVVKAGVHPAIVKPAFAMCRAYRMVMIGDAVAQGRLLDFGFACRVPLRHLLHGHCHSTVETATPQPAVPA